MALNSIARIKQAITDRTLVPFVGSGLSVACAGLPTWPQLLTSGISYLQANRQRLRLNVRDISRLRSSSKVDVVNGLSQLQKYLADGHREHWRSDEYAGWLESEFGRPQVRNAGLLAKLSLLEPRVVVTTNYDTLLEEYAVAGDRSVTWEKPQDLRAMLRGGRGVAHLHGRYDHPRSVILSAADYQRIVDDRDAFRVSRSLFESGILLFIGVSVDGVTDPHLETLLDHFTKLSDPVSGEDHPHLFLHAGELPPRSRAALRAKGVESYKYGETYDDLEPFLGGLAGPEKILVQLSDVARVTREILGADSIAAGVRAAATEIERWVFPGRTVRVSYAELKDDSGATRRVLEENYAAPGIGRSFFHFPISIAGWALVEGRPIAWPAERASRCNIEHIRRIGRLDELRERIEAEIRLPTSPLRSYIDLDSLMAKVDDETLTIGDLFQDWTNRGSAVVFRQFVSFPVPRAAAVPSTALGSNQSFAGVGVFNIDTLDEQPVLMTAGVEEKLELLSALVYELYKRDGTP